MSRRAQPRPTAATQSATEERTAPERPADIRPAGRSSSPGHDARDRAVARLQELGCTGRGAYWTCPRHGGRNRKLLVTPAKRHPGGVFIHCYVCDSGRSRRAGSLVLEEMGWSLEDCFANGDGARHRNRDVARSSHVGVNSVPTRSRPCIKKLETEYAAGERVPEPVELGPMPERATPDMRRIAEDMRHLLGLFASAGERRPMPYACTWASERMGWGRRAFRRANDAIRALERAGTIRHAESCAQREKAKSRTKCYRAPSQAELREAEPLPVDGVKDSAVGVERALGRAAEPSAELADQARVDGTEPAAEDVGMVAVGYGASATFGGAGHAHEDNAVIGSQQALDLRPVAAARVAAKPSDRSDDSAEIRAFLARLEEDRRRDP